LRGRFSNSIRYKWTRRVRVVDCLTNLINRENKTKRKKKISRTRKERMNKRSSCLEMQVNAHKYALDLPYF
jgi:hypothetical protein